MIVKEVLVDILLGLAVATVAASSVGVLVMGDVYQKLHFVTPAAMVAPVLVALAVLVEKGYYENTTETWLALLFVVMAAPLVTHATIRAARIREQGDWRRPLAPGDRPGPPAP